MLVEPIIPKIMLAYYIDADLSVVHCIHSVASYYPNCTVQVYGNSHVSDICTLEFFQLRL